LSWGENRNKKMSPMSNADRKMYLFGGRENVSKIKTKEGM